MPLPPHACMHAGFRCVLVPDVSAVPEQLRLRLTAAGVSVRGWDEEEESSLVALLPRLLLPAEGDDMW